MIRASNNSSSWLVFIGAERYVIEFSNDVGWPAAQARFDAAVNRQDAWSGRGKDAGSHFCPDSPPFSSGMTGVLGDGNVEPAMEPACGPTVLSGGLDLEALPHISNRG